MAVRAASGTGYLSKASAVTGAPYTIIAWFRTADVTAAGTNLWSTNNSGFTQYDYCTSSNTLDTAVKSGSQSAAVDSASGAMAADTWAPLSMTRTSNTRVAWSVQTRIAATNTSAETGGYDIFTLLGFGGMGSEPNRDVAGYKAWNALLTDAEIALEVQQFAPVRQTNLAHYSPLHDHTDLADDVAGGSWTNNGATLSTVTGPDLPEEWDGPTVASSNTTAATSSSGGLSINMPSGIAAGDLLLAFASNDTSVSWSSGWTTIDNGANGTAVQGACFAKIAAGGDTLTITGEANDIAVVTVRVVNHGVSDVSTDITLGSAATGTDSAPNAPNCNPGTSAARLWLSYFASDDDDNTTYWWPVESAPVSQLKSTTGTSSTMVGVAQRWLTASSYNPSTFLMAASEEWRAQTLGIPPLGVITGTLAATESGADTAALAGDVLIDGALAATESGADVAAINGTALAPISGTLDTTEAGADTAAIAGDVLIDGTLDATEAGSDTAALTGAVPVAGTIDATETGADVAALTGDVFVTGTLAATESGADTAAIVGAVRIAGALDASESGSDVAALAGAVIVSGALAADEAGADTATIAGAVIVAGLLDTTESGSDTAEIVGTVVSATVTGYLDATESGDDAASIAGAVLVSGALAATEAGDTAAIAGTTVAATVAVNLHPLNRARSRYAVRLGGEMVFVDSPQALQAAIDDFEQQTQERARRKGEAVAKTAPRTTPKAAARAAPRVSVVEAPEVDREALAAQMAATNARIRETYENATRAALIARYLEIEMQVQDDEAAIMALEA